MLKTQYVTIPAGGAVQVGHRDGVADLARTPVTAVDLDGERCQRFGRLDLGSTNGTGEPTASARLVATRIDSQLSTIVTDQPDGTGAPAPSTRRIVLGAYFLSRR